MSCISNKNFQKGGFPMKDMGKVLAKAKNVRSKRISQKEFIKAVEKRLLESKLKAGEKIVEMMDSGSEADKNFAAGAFIQLLFS